MAANFWLSTHCKYWLLTKEDLIVSSGRQEDLKYLTAEEYQKIHILFANFIQALGEHLKHRQQVIAAATHYFKRFYSKNSLKNIDPLLLAPTCLYLASKVEENGVISNNRLIQTCATVVKNKFMAVFNCEYPYRINQVKKDLGCFTLTKNCQSRDIGMFNYKVWGNVWHRHAKRIMPTLSVTHFFSQNLDIEKVKQPPKQYVGQ